MHATRHQPYRKKATARFVICGLLVVGAVLTIPTKGRSADWQFTGSLHNYTLDQIADRQPKGQWKIRPVPAKSAKRGWQYGFYSMDYHVMMLILDNPPTRRHLNVNDHELRFFKILHWEWCFFAKQLFRLQVIPDSLASSTPAGSARSRQLFSTRKTMQSAIKRTLGKQRYVRAMQLAFQNKGLVPSLEIHWLREYLGVSEKDWLRFRLARRRIEVEYEKNLARKNDLKKNTYNWERQKQYQLERLMIKYFNDETGLKFQLLAGERFDFTPADQAAR